MNKAQTDKQFALMVEDFYDDHETAAEYENSTKSQSDVFLRKIAVAVIVAMVALSVVTYVIQNPITIPVALISAVTYVVYRNMVKDYEKKKN